MSDDYRAVLGTLRGAKGPLRRGLTTGSCAQAAAAAAAVALLSGEKRGSVRIRLPESKKAWSGLFVSVPVAGISLEAAGAHAREAEATVIKDSGDDADITNGMPVVATARAGTEPGVRVCGGVGVGCVTRPGLPVAVGKAAINPVPLGMIRSSVEEVLAGAREGRYGEQAAEFSRELAGIDITIALPMGVELAARTWNPRIGVEGGLSVIGTSGVVEPASSEAFRRSIWRSARAFRARALERPWISPGYVGEAYLKALGIPDDEVLVVGDHIGFTLDACARLGFVRVGLAAHIGKLSKLAAGLFNTHARYGDARLETLAACASAAGGSPTLARRILELKLAEEAISLINESGLPGVWDDIAARAAWRARLRCGLPVTCVALDLKGNALGKGEYP